uniref:Nonstructural protein NSP1.pep1 n=1 Tax=Porcine rotavirus B TaxID=449582 RepID=G3XHM9_9REOV|nr:nonstructural protein NSP1.pep1 [Porcine rotavirus B]
MGSRQSSLQSQTHRTDINSHHSNIYLQGTSTATFQTQHIIVTVGAALLALLLASLIFSLICNCYLLSRLRHESQRISRTREIQERFDSNLSKSLV